MGYLGNAPARSFISFERQVFTIVNSQTAYTLSHSVTNENDIRLVINNIVQEPGSGKAYTASGTTLTLSAALVNGTDEMYCVFLGRAVGTVNAPAGSVSTSQLAGDAVTEAKIADGAVESEHLNNNVISGQTELATTPADTDEFLISDAGTIKRIDYSYIKGSSDWVKLASSDATSVSSIEFQDVFTTDYRHYRIIGADINPNNDQLVFQFLTSGSTAITTGYYSIAEEVMGNSSTTANQNTKRWNGDDINVVEQNTGTDLTQAAWFDMTLVNPTDSASYRSGVLTSGQFANNGQLYNLNKSFTQISTGSSYGGIKFQGNGSQTINHAKITIYGVK